MTIYHPGGKQEHTDINAIREQQAQMQREAEMRDMPRRMELAKLQEQEAKARGGGLSPADQLAREKFEWEKGGGKAAYKPMTADQEAKYRQKFGEAYGTTMSALQSSQDVVNTAADLRKSAGLEGITGVSGYLWNRPGGADAEAQQKFETLQGKVTKMAKDAAASSLENKTLRLYIVLQ